MKKPKMILFDYGQTLADEKFFDGIAGTQAVLDFAVNNRHGYTAQQIQEQAQALNRELGRFDPATRHLSQVEIPNYMFTAYLYSSMGITLSLSPAEIDRVFWNAASPAVPTEGIESFLSLLGELGIRTGVISNICYCGDVVRERITSLLPDAGFEFIIPTSEYLFRKPNRHIFELALEMAGLPADEVWYIGDNYECDIVGASGAGLTAVWYLGASRGSTACKNDVFTVHSWDELSQKIKILCDEG